MIENPHGKQKILKDKAVTNRRKGAEKLKPEDITQIQPQKLILTLRSGENTFKSNIFWSFFFFFLPLFGFDEILATMIVQSFFYYGNFM